MTTFEAIILGLVQGLTEFIPVSSSGHLILARDVLGIATEGSLAFDAVLQLATGIAVLLYFWKDWIRLGKASVSFLLQKQIEIKEKNTIFAIVLGTIPAVFIGLALEDYMDTIFRSANVVAITLIMGSVLMWFAEKYAQQNAEVTPKKGLVIGFFQSLALLPGMSRSGSTISGGLLMGLKREDAARFSFLLATPIILGAGTKKLIDLIQEGSLVGDSSMPLIIGSLVSFVVGLIAIHWLLIFLRTRSLMPFVWYRLVIAILIFILL